MEKSWQGALMTITVFGLFIGCGSDGENNDDEVSPTLSDDLNCTLPNSECDPMISPEITFKAEEGTMLVFPGWLPHKVPRNNSDRRRVSISFNALCPSA